MANTYDSSNMERINLTKGNKKYYYNTENGKYYVWTVPVGGTGGFSGGNVLGYQEVTNEAEIKDLKSEFPYGSDAVQEDYNPYLNTESTISTRLAVGRAVAPENARSVRYPHDMRIGDSEDFVLFDFYDYKPPFANRAASGGTTQGAGTIGTVIDYNDAAMYADSQKSSRFKDIIMYMPEDISTGFRSNWGGKAFSTIGANMLAAAGQEGLDKKLQAGIASLGETAERFVPIQSAAALRKGIQTITGDTLSNDDVFGSISGAIMNPNTELLFQSVDMSKLHVEIQVSS